MSQAPTLSVVFPNFNDARFLPFQLNSMLAQSYRPKEIVIIDDASTDNSVEVIEEFIAREPRIRLIRNERNKGVEHNINRLIQEASGDYLYLSAADDAVLPGFFEKCMALLAEYPQAGLCSGLGRLMNEKGRDSGLRVLPVVSKKPCYLSPKHVRELLSRYGRWFALSSMIIKRDALLGEGGQVAAVGSFADNLAAMVVALRHGACFIPEEFSSWRQKQGAHGSSADWETLAENGKLIVEIMRTRYADLFPRKYVDRFEQHWRYGVHITASVRTYRDAQKIVTKVFDRSSGSGTLLDGVGLSAIQISLRLHLLFWRIYAMARFGPWQWWALGRLTILLNRGTFLIREDQRP
jgi:glycosyltransferase involved in cell wall biosynthesis